MLAETIFTIISVTGGVGIPTIATMQIRGVFGHHWGTVPVLNFKIGRFPIFFQTDCTSNYFFWDTLQIFY